MKSIAPKVSVIVPTFNRAALLKETVDSILAQTYTNFELIIVDNMSDDGTQGYIDNYKDTRIRYFRNHNNGIISVNRNHGIRHATGEFIALCDDDDLWVPEKLEQQVHIMLENENLGLCYSNASRLSKNEMKKEWHIRRKFHKNHFKRLLIGNFIPNSSVLIRKIVLEKTGLIDESLDFVGAEDYELWLRISYQYNIHYIDKPLIKYRIHANNASGSMAKVAKRDLLVLKSIYQKLNIPLIFMAVPFIFKTARWCVYSFIETLSIRRLIGKNNIF